MIYVPMLKTRKAELRVAKKMNYCFSDNIIPLFEVLSDSTPLNLIIEIIENKKAFIDYFRFDVEKYGKSVNVNGVELALKLSRDNVLYKNKVKEISKYRSLIPTVSIKPGFVFRKNELEEYLLELQTENEVIALRITEEFLDEHNKILRDVLRSKDYLLFDIGEQTPSSKIMEMDEVMELEINAKKILLNSPRKARIKNGDYEELKITGLIDNSAREIFHEYEFDGVGDYCGLKDVLPSTGGSNGKGAALALIYDYKENGFFSFLNSDISEGMRGYLKIIPKILSKRDVLDPLNNCPALHDIERLKKSGNWSTWHNITATRYIHQMYSNI